MEDFNSRIYNGTVGMSKCRSRYPRQKGKGLLSSCAFKISTSIITFTDLIL